ncbi:hypothetical protein LCGC14_0727090 [marine sediment metagenome]|uniref:Uncharacterized protein n=1 Tax=marine sediment metagenome TaxID=412755 RepID=A0A0F9QEU7_9ZZZZ
MSVGVTMTLEGGPALEAKLIALGRKVGQKIAKTAVRNGSKIILASAKGNAKSMVGGTMGGHINRALQLRVGKAKRKGQFFIRVQHNPKFNDVLVSYARGASSSLATRKTSGRRHYIPNAIEYGHAFPGQSGGAKSVAAIPYLRTAFDRNVRNAERTIRRTLFSDIERAWRVG